MKLNDESKLMLEGFFTALVILAVTSTMVFSLASIA